MKLVITQIAMFGWLLTAILFFIRAKLAEMKVQTVLLLLHKKGIEASDEELEDCAREVVRHTFKIDK